MKALLVLVAMTGVADASHCHEVSPIVGREVCREFGSRWAHSPVYGLAISFMTSTFVVERIAFPALDDHSQLFAASGSAVVHHAHLGAHALTAYGYRSGISYRGPRWTADFEVAGAGGDGPEAVTDIGTSTLAERMPEYVVDFDLAFGPHVRFGRIDVGASLAPGIRLESASEPMPEGYSACPAGTSCKAPVLSATTTFVDARGRIDVWLSHHVTLGVIAGVELETLEPTFGLALRYHLAAFDGT